MKELKIGQKIRFKTLDNVTAKEIEADGRVFGTSEDLKKHRPDEFGNAPIDAYWIRDEIFPDRNSVVTLMDVIKIYDEKKEVTTMSKDSTKTKATETKKATPKKKAKKAKANNHEQSILRNRLFDGCKDMVKAKMKKDPKTSKATIQTMIEKKFPGEVPRFFSFYMLDRLGLRKNVAKLKKDRPEVKMIQADLEYLESQKK